MAFSNGMITAPISIDDVKQALGVGSNDLATLCKSTKINMWSRNKPMSINKLFDITTEDKQHANFGINIPSLIPTLTDLINNAHSWTYTKPSGGMASPYRLVDFNGYFVNAVSPIKIVFPSEIKTNQSTTYQNYVFSPVLTFENGVLNWNAYSLSFSEAFSLPEYRNLYPSLVFYTPSTGVSSIVTTAYTVNEISNNGGTYAAPFVVNVINAHFAGYAAGTQVKVIPCLQANKYINITTNFNPAYYVSLELGTGMSEVKTYSLVVDKVTIPPTPPTPTYSLSFSYTRSNYGSGYQYTITGISITNTNNLASTFNVIGSIAGQYVTGKSVTMKSSVSVPANGTVNISSFIDNYFYTTATNCNGALSVSLSTGTSRNLVLPGSTSGTIY